MRSALLVAVVLVAGLGGVARGEMLTASELLPSLVSNTSGPWTTTFQLNQGQGSGRTTIAEFTLPTIADDDIFTITQANVGDFGETWENVLLWSNGLNNIPDWTYRTVAWTHNGVRDNSSGQDVVNRLLDGEWFVHLTDFVPTSFTLDFMFNDREPPLADRAFIEWTLAGEGIIAPEPSSFVMALLLGLCASSLFRSPSGHRRKTLCADC